jgi:uncharacterized delta-60 repeat protein
MHTRVLRLPMAALAILSIAGTYVAFAATPSSAASNTNGSLDTTFATKGIAVVSTASSTSDNTFGAALLSNGDILTLGGYGLARFLPSGKLDTTFGSKGFSAALPSGVAVQAMGVEPNGTIVGVGSAQGAAGSEFAIVRYTANGSLDKSFGTGGLVTSQFPLSPQSSTTEDAGSVVIQPNGDLLVGGSIQQIGYKDGVAEAAVLRLLPSGALDKTFGSGGQLLTTQSGTTEVTAIGLDSSGDIYLLPGDIELSSTGHVDATTTPESLTTISRGGDETFLSTGGYVEAEAVGVAKHEVAVEVQRFNSGGALASSSPEFDFSGNQNEAEDSPGAVVVQPNGQVVVAGSRFADGADLFGLARVNANGTLDTTFGSGGTLTTSIAGGFGFQAVLLEPNGEIIGVGTGQAADFGDIQIILAKYIG